MDSTALKEHVLSLAHGDREEAEARLLLLAEQRQQQKYVAYMEPCGDQVQVWEKLRPGLKTLILSGGNQAGKTRFGAWLAAVYMLGKDFFRGELNWKWIESLPLPPLPTTVRAVGLDEKLLKDPIWETLMGRAYAPGPMFPPSAIEHASERDMTARLKNGSRFHMRSAAATVDPKTHGGIKCDLVWIDEECGRAYYDENYQRTVTKGGLLLVTATPLSDKSAPVVPWLHELIERAEEGDPETAVVYLSTLNNPHIPDEEKRRLVAKWRGHPEEGARLYGKPIHRAGLYYSMWRAEPPLWVPTRDIPRDRYRVVVLDPASTGPVGAVWLAYDRDGKQTVYRTYKRQAPSVSEHVQNILAENRGDPIDLWLCDPFMGRQRLPRAQGEHETVIQVWRNAGLPRLRLAEVDNQVCLDESKEYMQAALDSTNRHPPCEIFDHCTEFRDEIERYVVDSVAQGPRRGESHDRPRKGNDDVLNAWQYACGMRLRARGERPKRLDPRTRNYFA